MIGLCVISVPDSVFSYRIRASVCDFWPTVFGNGPTMRSRLLRRILSCKCGFVYNALHVYRNCVSINTPFVLNAEARYVIFLFSVTSAKIG